MVEQSDSTQFLFSVLLIFVCFFVSVWERRIGWTTGRCTSDIKNLLQELRPTSLSVILTTASSRPRWAGISQSTAYFGILLFFRFIFRLPYNVFCYFVFEEDTILPQKQCDTLLETHMTGVFCVWSCVSHFSPERRMFATCHCFFLCCSCYNFPATLSHSTPFGISFPRICLSNSEGSPTSISWSYFWSR